MNKPLVPIEELLGVWSSIIRHREAEVARPFYLKLKLSKVWVPLNSLVCTTANRVELYCSIRGISRAACAKCLFYSVLMHAAGSLGISALAHVRSFPSGSI